MFSYFKKVMTSQVGCYHDFSGLYSLSVIAPTYYKDLALIISDGKCFTILLTTCPTLFLGDTMCEHTVSHWVACVKS